MPRIPICLVGCGGMGSRHITGYAALERTGLANVELVAVCDINQENAARAADDVERLLGRRPTIHHSMDAALADKSIAAYDIVTEAWTHVGVAIPALEAGRHVLCEKPLALTVRGCRALMDAAERGGAVLATAENYRRDPPNRLARAVIEAGLLGHVHLMTQFHVGGDDRIIITPWRHMKDKGAIGLDMGCHLTDIAQYYLGEFASVSGCGFIAEPVRRRRDKPEQDTPTYHARLAQMPLTVTPTGEDSLVATYKMEGGELSQISYIPSGPGQRWLQRSVHGRLGSLEMGRDRTGTSPVLHLGKGRLKGAEILAELPDYHLDEVTARLFGSEKAVDYDLPFAGSDAALMAIEIHDFANAVLTDRQPEVGGHHGTTAVAAVLAAYESGLVGRSVTMAEIMTGELSAYQDEIDRATGLLR